MGNFYFLCTARPEWNIFKEHFQNKLKENLLRCIGMQNFKVPSHSNPRTVKHRNRLYILSINFDAWVTFI